MTEIRAPKVMAKRVFDDRRIRERADLYKFIEWE